MVPRALRRLTNRTLDYGLSPESFLAKLFGKPHTIAHRKRTNLFLTILIDLNRLSNKIQGQKNVNDEALSPFNSILVAGFSEAFSTLVEQMTLTGPQDNHTR